MSVALRIFLFGLSLIFLVYVVRLVAQGRLLLKYSLLWMATSLVLMICAIFPGIVSAAAGLVGVQLSANFVFLVGFIALLGICLSLTAIVSWQSRDVRQLIQRCALLEKRVGELEQREGNVDPMRTDNTFHVDASSSH